MKEKILRILKAFDNRITWIILGMFVPKHVVEMLDYILDWAIVLIMSIGETI